MIHADTLLKGGTVITVDPERRIIRQGAVAMSGSEIVAVGKTDELLKTVDAREIIDCKNKLIMPGFVNTHLHFYHTMHRSLAPEDLGGWLWSNYVHGKVATQLTEEDEIYGGLTVLLETLKSGTTTFLEAGSYNPKSVIEGLSEIGMRGLMGRRSFDQAILGHSMLLESTEDCIALNRQFMDEYKDGYNGGLIKACVDVVGLGRVTNELYLASKKMADEYGTTMNLHLAAMVEEVTDTRMKTGRRPVENLHHIGALGENVVLVHMVHVTDPEIEMLRDTGTNVIHCPSTALKLNYGLSSHGRFPEMVNRGVNVGIGSDAADCSNYACMIRTMYLAAALPKDYRNFAGASNAELAIEMATINGAKAIGMDKEIGSLETGKKADIILLNMHRPEWYPNYSEVQNLVYSTSGDSVETVYINGKLVMKDRKVLTVDEDEVLYKTQELGEKLLKRGNLTVPGRWPIL